MNPKLKSLLAVAGLATLAGCGVTGAPERAYDVRQPKANVVRTFTNFSESLRCMDNLFARFGVANVVITSDGIPDATGKVAAGTKDMLISAISKMSVRSKAFAFVDFDQRQEDVANLQQLVGFTDEFRVPSYYIRGAITQLDEGVIAESIGGSLALPNFELGASKDQVVSVIATDMNIGKLVTRQIMAGMSASNSVVVRRSGAAGDIGGTIKKVGLSFNISMNKQEGLHQATRTLIELSAIEILGKLTRVPYWRCLKIEQTNPYVVAETREWFDSMSKEGRVSYAQRALKAAGEYRGPAHGRLDSSTREAIGRFQSKNSLIATGSVDFDLYRTLISKDIALGKGSAPNVTKPAPDKQVASVPLRISMTTPKGVAPVYRLKEQLSMTVTTSRDAFIYCYYQDARGSVARIFPNKFRPNALISANSPLDLPGNNSRFGIIFDTAGAKEEVLCIASTQEVGLRLPNKLKQKDLSPLPVASLDELVSAYRKVTSSGVTNARLPISVRK